MIREALRSEGKIALRIIEQQAGPLDPDRLVDRYEEALKALIAAKQQGRTHNTRPIRAEAHKGQGKKTRQANHERFSRGPH